MLRPPDDIERYRLVRVAAKTTDLKIAVTGVEGITDRRRRLHRSFVTEHPHVPRLATKTIGLLARVLSSLGRHLDRYAVAGLSGLGRHHPIFPLS
jgi:hypothetical protein